MNSNTSTPEAVGSPVLGDGLGAAAEPPNYWWHWSCMPHMDFAAAIQFIGEMRRAGHQYRPGGDLAPVVFSGLRRSAPTQMPWVVGD